MESKPYIYFLRAIIPFPRIITSLWGRFLLYGLSLNWFSCRSFSIILLFRFFFFYMSTLWLFLETSEEGTRSLSHWVISPALQVFIILLFINLVCIRVNVCGDAHSMTDGGHRTTCRSRFSLLGIELRSSSMVVSALILSHLTSPIYSSFQTHRSYTLEFPLHKA